VERKFLYYIWFFVGVVVRSGWAFALHSVFCVSLLGRSPPQSSIHTFFLSLPFTLCVHHLFHLHRPQKCFLFRFVNPKQNISLTVRPSHPPLGFTSLSRRHTASLLHTQCPPSLPPLPPSHSSARPMAALQGRSSAGSTQGGGRSRGRPGSKARCDGRGCGLLACLGGSGSGSRRGRTRTASGPRGTPEGKEGEREGRKDRGKERVRGRTKVDGKFGMLRKGGEKRGKRGRK
jgi:hypothetical protein